MRFYGLVLDEHNQLSEGAQEAFKSNIPIVLEDHLNNQGGKGKCDHPVGVDLLALALCYHK